MTRARENANFAIPGVGIRTEGSIIGYGITFIDYRGAGISTITKDTSTGISTVNVTGGGGGGGFSDAYVASILFGR